MMECSQTKYIKKKKKGWQIQSWKDLGWIDA